MSVRLYIGNLHKDMEKGGLEAVFSEFDDLVSIKLVTDRKTGKCRGFGFVTVKTDEQADAIIEKLNGHVVHDNPLKIEKALPRTKGKGEGDSEQESENGNRRKGNGKNRRGQPAVSKEVEAAQPDPRWAADLAKLKERLEAQTANS